MGIKYIKSSSAINTVRPRGYKYPVGLSYRAQVGIGDVNVATNTTGGTQTIDGTNAVHTFTTSDNFTPSFTGNIEYLIVAGGGGGGGRFGGAGGAGGLRYGYNYPVISSTNYTATVGAGGNACPAPPVRGGSGGDSFITFSGATPGPTGNVVSIGGGGGGCNDWFPGGSENSAVAPGGPGGSGGGGAVGPIGPSPSPAPGGAGTPGQGNSGGTGSPPISSAQNAMAGGGGAGAPGNNGTTGTGGPGGDGLEYSISGSATYYAGGGGGGGFTPGSGGNGGGGAGGGSQSPAPPSAAGNGEANRGGGAGSGYNGPTGSGGSGIVIVRYIKTQSQETIIDVPVIE